MRLLMLVAANFFILYAFLDDFVNRIKAVGQFFQPCYEPFLTSNTSVKTQRALFAYHIGLNLTAAMLAVRGVPQALGTVLSSSISAAISGVSRIGHIVQRSRP